MSKPADPRSLLRDCGLHPKKSWGQSFLVAGSVHQRIVDALGPDTGIIIEVAAGVGSLSVRLAATDLPLIAVERDPELIPILTQQLQPFSNARVLAADLMALPWAELTGDGPLWLAGNLPYHLASRFIVDVTLSRRSIRRAVVLIQKEVAGRLTAQPGTRAYGLLSVIVQLGFAPRVVASVPPGAFHPPPKVHSAVVVLEPIARRPADHEAQIVRVARALFQYRRKTVRRGLQEGFGLDGAAAVSVLTTAQVRPDARPEELGPDEFLRIGDSSREQSPA